MKKNLWSALVALVVGGVWYYFTLPAINLHSFAFWIWIFMMLGVFSLVNLFFDIDIRGRIPEVRKSVTIPFISIVVCLLLIFIVNLVLSPVFQSKSYSNRIEIKEDGVFTEDVIEVDPTTLPLLDRDSSSKLGDRVMGQMPEMVSQFYVSDYYTQINFNNKIVRVTPLEYNGLFKYLNNRKNGVTGYITVNSVSGESKLVKLDKGMKYMPSAIFGEDLYRHLRFSYPLDVFGQENFEIDNSGNPYWIVPVIKYSGVGLKRDVSSVVILNPITGESKKYKLEDVPTWVDHVFESYLIMEQVDDWGSYRNGFLNSVFGQKNVVMTTTGYNYTVMNDDVYLYTGITSVSNDEANVGFIMSNMRTKETTYYSVPGAEEYSAMASAEGQVQQMKYTATFPLLINLNNKPTYLISLKDNAGLVKQYALVDVVDYQKVVVTDASLGIEKAFSNYLGDSLTEENESDLSKEIIVSKITSASIDGTTYYYITDTEGKKYSVSIKKNKNLLPFVEKDSKLTIFYRTEKDVTEITKIK